MNLSLYRERARVAIQTAVVSGLLLLFVQPVRLQANDGDLDYIEIVQRHFDFVASHAIDEYGEMSTAMWLATFDPVTGGLPEKPLPDELRWYRKITSPNGSNLYWDQPTIVAAYALSKATGEDRYARLADRYIDEFLSRCVAAESGLFLWGNHVYYDVILDEPVRFSGGYHECRPHTPAWETFWRHDAQATERAIRAMAKAHIKDRETGRFCRHANPRVAAGDFEPGEVENAKPFLEAGVTLIDSMCWLAWKTDDLEGDLVRDALAVARYSYRQRDERTGLLRNQPVDKRWDYYASTTEVGLWAGSLLRAAKMTGNDEFQQIAADAIRPWLRFGFDESSQKYFGRLSVESGLPQPPETERGWKPPMYAEVFDIHERPTHNYPMPMAEACLSLYEQTQDPVFLQAVERWVAHIGQSLSANDGIGAYAEDYGRVIHFLKRSAQSLNREQYAVFAEKVANEAVDRLFIDESGAFRSHPGEDRCDAVDGLGFLLLSLILLETHELPESAIGW